MYLLTLISYYHLVFQLLVALLQSLTVTIFDMGLIFFDEGLDQIFNGAFPGAFGIVCRRPTTNKIICLGAMCCFSSNLFDNEENQAYFFNHLIEAAEPSIEKLQVAVSRRRIFTFLSKNFFLQLRSFEVVSQRRSSWK